MFKGSRDDTSQIFNGFTTLHCMGLTCTGLTVSEDCTIIALEDTLNNWKGSLLENILLQTGWFKDHIKAEVPLFFSHIFGTADDDLASIWNDFNDRLISMSDFLI
jgi:hypothetical protein